MLLLLPVAWILFSILDKRQERKRNERGFWVEYVCPGLLRGDEDQFAIVYHEQEKWQLFFDGKISRPKGMSLLFPNEVQWQEQMPQWLQGKREIVLERIRQEEPWLQIVAEPT